MLTGRDRFALICLAQGATSHQTSYLMAKRVSMRVCDGHAITIESIVARIGNHEIDD